MQMSLMLGLSLLVAAPAPKEVPKKDPPSLIGEWVPESAILGGKNDPPPPGSSITFTKEGKCFVKEGGDAKPDSMSFTFDAKKDPAEIDISEPRAGMGEKAIKGIYKIDGDTMQMCLSIDGERPKAFASPAGSQSILITLKRVKKD
jgi:uncharacterized protein (TIGR03067 family)